MDVVIVKTMEGLRGLGEDGERAYDKWKAFVAHMGLGETCSFKWKRPRSPGFHKLFFAMLGELSKRQEQFSDDQLRAWLTVGAGYAEFVPGPTGRMVALPKSIAWERMEEDEFRLLVQGVWSFLRTEHAQRFLWPQLSREQTEETVESLLMEFEQ